MGGQQWAPGSSTMPQAKVQQAANQLFDQLDTNHDGVLQRDEFQTVSAISDVQFQLGALQCCLLNYFHLFSLTLLPPALHYIHLFSLPSA